MLRFLSFLWIKKGLQVQYHLQTEGFPVSIRWQEKATKYGDILMENLSLRLKRSISANPMAAIRKPLVVCKMVSQIGIFT